MSTEKEQIQSIAKKRLGPLIDGFEFVTESLNDDEEPSEVLYINASRATRQQRVELSEELYDVVAKLRLNLTVIVR